MKEGGLKPHQQPVAVAVLAEESVTMKAHCGSVLRGKMLVVSISNGNRRETGLLKTWLFGACTVAWQMLSSHLFGRSTMSAVFQQPCGSLSLCRTATSPMAGGNSIACCRRRGAGITFMQASQVCLYK